MWARASRSCFPVFCTLDPPNHSRSLHERDARTHTGVVYNQRFRHTFWSDKKMIRFLQTPGPIKKIVLGGLLTVICAAMAITLIPGGIGDSIGLGGPGQGVVAKVAGEPVTALEVQREARQML